MIILRKEDVLHKIQLTRLLTAILDNPLLAQNLFFKGGTCAAMLGYLDRFSVDLDFDLKKDADMKKMRDDFHKVFEKCDLALDSESKISLDFIVKYKAEEHKRNTIKIDALNLYVSANKYEPKLLDEINRYANCQTIETMFANKLVAPFDRFARHAKIAGRDLYDIHHFFLKGYKFDADVILERTRKKLPQFFKDLIAFIEKNFTETIIIQDLNTLLPADKFQTIRKILKNETIMFLKNELGD